ncbi:MAG: pyridoxal phosphate-dependent aminotransferase [Lachnospiraceae bacterium]|nr:pyridoxal phosphate-dependent aminotransferase [Lachnospiraceae bacterium]
MSYSQEMYGLGSQGSEIREIFEYGRRRKAEIGADKVFDFSLGNPSVPTPQAVTDAMIDILSTAEPTAVHGYTSGAGDMACRTAIAEDLNARYNCGADPALIYMTCGAAAALCCSFRALATEDADEFIAFAPFFPEYRVFCDTNGGKLVQVMMRENDFQIDLGLLDAAVNERTKGVVINSPNNPCGVVYTEETIRGLAAYLEKKQAEYGHPIYLITDEPYRELVYGGAVVPFVPNCYDNTIVCYSYSKSLSLPGERIGYALVSPKAADAKAVYAAICGAGRALGYVCAPSLMQHVITRCAGVQPNLAPYEENRRILLEGLTGAGFTCVNPDGAFYLFMKSPEPDAHAFAAKAKEYELLVVPCDSFGCPGYVRIGYCVSKETIEGSLPGFRALAAEYGLN